jgi:hypothetical protein
MPVRKAVVRGMSRRDILRRKGQSSVWSQASQNSARTTLANSNPFSTDLTGSRPSALSSDLICYPGTMLTIALYGACVRGRDMSCKE